MSKKHTVAECPVCLGVHNEAIHVATVRLHIWWREFLRRRFYEPQNEAQRIAMEKA